MLSVHLRRFAGSRNQPQKHRQRPRRVLAVSINLIGGFSNTTLRPLVEQLLDEPYGQARWCYDLRRLKLKGRIVKLNHSNTYVLTGDGQRFASSDTKIHNRLLQPLVSADHPPAPPDVRQTLRTLERAVGNHIREARIAAIELGSTVNHPVTKGR